MQVVEICKLIFCPKQVQIYTCVAWGSKIYWSISQKIFASKECAKHHLYSIRNYEGTSNVCVETIHARKWTF